MNEFTRMIQEAFVGAEPFDPAPGSAALREALLRFERRDRVVRTLSWFMVAVMTGASVWAAWGFWTAGPEASTRTLIAYATLFLCGFGGIGFGKMFLLEQQANFNVLCELKRMQLSWSESR